MNEVTLSKDATSSCMAACDAFVIGVQQMLGVLREEVTKESFGTLNSGQALGQKFVDVFTGKDYSLREVLEQHIEVVLKLRSSFEAAGQRYVETDDQNAANLTAQQPK